MPLTDTRARNAKPGPKVRKLADEKSLYLLVHPSGAKYWRLKYRVAGKEKVLALGVYPDVSLARTRELAAEARQLVKGGRDPVTERRANKASAAANAATTFAGVAREWIESRRGKWSPSYTDMVEGTLSRNLFPRIGALPVADITAPMLLAALRPIEARGALEVVARARRWAGEVFRYAVATGRTGSDPAAVLKGALKVGQVTHHPALKRDELGDFLRKLTEYTGRPETRIALPLLLLTFVRPGELRAAQWTEIDLDRREWRIPADRMKARTEHVVPLSRQAVAAIEELRMLTGYSAYLFPGGRSRVPYMSENTINKAIALLGYKGRVVGHGFRATASTILNDSGKFPVDAIERQLAHAERNRIRAAYHRAEYLAERRKMMQWWADILSAATNGAPVVTLPRRA